MLAVATSPSHHDSPAVPSGPLAGLLVADFTRVLAGPYATMLLGDLGAEVIKIERPDAGDDTRAWGPPFAPDGQSSYFHSVNRNKTSVAWNLDDPDDLDRARRLALRADVVIENFKSGALDRRGLGYPHLVAENPGVVYCSISGFGSGAGAELPGYDLLVQAMGGLMSITGTDPDSPTKVGVALVDVLTGLHATVGILAALQERTRSGRGQRVEVNLLSSLLSGMVNQAAGYVTGGVVPGILGNAHPSIAPYEVFDTADRPLVLAVGNNVQFAALAAELGEPALAADQRFASNPDRVRNRAQLTAALTALLAHDTAENWQVRLTGRGVPCGPINDISEAFALAERLGLQPVVRIPDGDSGAGYATVANPITFSRTPAAYRLAPPQLGTDRG
ncbi:MAG: CoA transferase [Actinobacteria bacterium]|nr:CoA transferase [Actinomycetota bacterium]